MGMFTDYLANSKMISNAADSKGADRIAKIQLNRIKDRTGDPGYPTAFAARDEVQSIAAFPDTVVSGNYTLTLTFNDGTTVTTAALAYNANAATIETAINTAANGNITGWADGDIGVSGGDLTANAVVLTFDGNSVDSLRHSAASIDSANTLAEAAAGAVTTTTPGAAMIPEVQSIAIYSGTVSGGNFTLTVLLDNSETFTTAAIAYDANAATIETAVDTAANGNVTSWTAGDITVAGGPLTTNAVTLTFDGVSVEGNQSLTTIDGSALTGGGSAGAITTVTPGVNAVDEVQSIAIYPDTVASGNFTVTCNTGAETFTTAAISYDANAATIETAIDTAANGNITSWTDGDISVAGGPLTNTAVTLTFDGNSVDGTNMVLSTIDDSNLRKVGDAPVVSITAYGQANRRAWSVMNMCGIVGETPPTQGDATGYTVINPGAPSPLRPCQDVIKLLIQDAALEDGNEDIYTNLSEDLGL